MWTDDKVRILINERKEGNKHYHSLGTSYTGWQASEQFHGIVKDCQLMELSFNGDWRERQMRNGERISITMITATMSTTVTKAITAATTAATSAVVTSE
ncbi:hypothetical protein GLOIN_2v1781315 [Rhizophagus clarus]|uniref:Uncharacterized protein n=1 Tax=Rhizophagus clarus TaxID=94130 RepID=A0A8H3R1M3_9GLOM|nr:hypothetical protein GLOIN_2v1781315 [Rhizophagus clarus]